MKRQEGEHKHIIASHHNEMQTLRDTLNLAVQKLESLYRKNEQELNDFKTQASLVKSNMAMAHGGARGGASPALAARFDAMINPHQSAAALKGGLDAFERWLTAYAGAKNSAELDAADQALGVGGVPSDSYANPDWGKK